ncbi:hypothetical protein DDE18_02505 [Nocardioides gansuensis]|uniref:Uncharacterized protein n=1 Tax=Nocardioides gansuensis TaxID=2138300 RepID=A0A2T8FGP7_9ACTN|nr:hypothetical protein [Nocardioides gansuensis]PVG84869.1 hypothetical protein DDE18_02505 [Nocardioides gansuensis]
MRVVVVPPVPALLSRYASLTDPVPELRAACVSAVAWLVEHDDARIVAADDQARRIGEELLAQGLAGRVASASERIETRIETGNILVMANGSARRSEKAPGHLDERSFGFDSEVEAALAAGDAAALGGLDARLGAELLASGIGALATLADLTVTRAVMDYADDPFGVRYWVVRWECAS